MTALISPSPHKRTMARIAVRAMDIIFSYFPFSESKYKMKLPSNTPEIKPLAGAYPSAHQAGGILSFDGSELPAIAKENRAVSIIARRHRLTIPRAILVCRLAGIGGAI